MRNWCRTCNAKGWVGWLWWPKKCEACGGDGEAKPPGWPDKDAMQRLRPAPPQPSRVAPLERQDDGELQRRIALLEARCDCLSRSLYQVQVFLHDNHLPRFPMP